MSFYNPINDIKNKYNWNIDAKIPNSIYNTFYIETLETLYFKNYDTFCWTIIPFKCKVINHFLDKEKKQLNEQLQNKNISDESKNELIQKMAQIKKAQEDANKINEKYLDLKKQNEENYVFNYMLLKKISTDYIKNQKIKDSFDIFMSLSKEILDNCTRSFIQNEKILINLYDNINNIKYIFNN